jgi:hypothetical protein
MNSIHSTPRRQQHRSVGRLICGSLGRKGERYPSFCAVSELGC